MRPAVVNEATVRPCIGPAGAAIRSYNCLKKQMTGKTVIFPSDSLERLIGAASPTRGLVCAAAL